MPFVPAARVPNKAMKHLLAEIRHNPLLWLLAFVPLLLAAEKLAPEAHTPLFVLSVLAIVPLAALLSHATESVAALTAGAGNDPAVNRLSAKGGARWKK
jgi:Ca2+/H+ antiporter